MKRAMAKQAEAEREKRAKIISAELGSFLAREQSASSPLPVITAGPIPPPAAAANGTTAG
jgi:regulator of protease activity HflC (stomatin/prohibitin superfamily)